MIELEVDHSALLLHKTLAHDLNQTRTSTRMPETRAHKRYTLSKKRRCTIQ